MVKQGALRRLSGQNIGLAAPRLGKLIFYLLSNWMGYDGGDSFHFDFEPN